MTEATPRRSRCAGSPSATRASLANDAHRSRPPPRRDPRPARRERRGQVDPDEHPLRARRARTRARSCIDGEPVDIARPARRHRPRHRHGPPALHAGPGPDRGREHPPRRGDDGQPGLPRPEARPIDGSSSSASSSASRSTRRRRSGASPSAGSSGSRSSRRSTARRGSSSSTSRPPSSRRRRPRRSSPSCAGWRPRATRIIFISHKLYEVLEIADRITVIRRGQVVGERIPAETNEEDLAELMVGRERPADGRSRRVAPGRRRADGERTARPRTTAAGRSSAASTSRSGPARSSASPASPATARTSWSRRIIGLRKPSAGHRHAGRRRRHRLDARDSSTRPAWPTSRATATAWADDLSFPLEDNLVLTSYYRPPVRSRASSARTRRSTTGPQELIERFDIRTPSATVTAEHAVRRQPAEGRRRPRVQPRA